MAGRADRRGTPQGGPLSPLLSNLMLDVLDKELERRGHRFVRYADDCNIYVQSRRAGERVMASVERFLTGRLKLKVNSAKSAVARPRGAQVSRLQLHQRSRTATSDRAAGAGPAREPGTGADAAHGWGEPDASHRPAVDLSDGLAWLFRVLPDA